MQRHDTHSSMVNPAIEGLLDRADSKFRLVTLSATRARQINAYFGQLGEGLGSSIPPQVTSTARKPLSIAFEEISADKIEAIEPPDEPEPTDEELAAIEAMELAELGEQGEQGKAGDDAPDEGA